MGFKGFFKKEINEILRTSKKFVLPSILLFFGFLSPLTAKYIKEIFNIAGGIEIEIPIPDPVYTDSFVQFYKNIGQIGIVVMILAFMGTVVEEKVKGSAILILTKPVSRIQFILSKFLSSLILFTASYILAITAFIYYTCILFPDYRSDYAWLSLGMPWIYGVFIISLTIFASTISKSHTMSAVYGFIGFAAISAVSILPRIGKYLPGALNNIGLEILTGVKPASDAVLPIVVAVVLSVLLILSSIAVFKRQEL